MSEISDLESRISAAMDRIGRGLEAVKAASSGDATDESAAEHSVDKAAFAEAQDALETQKAHAIELQARIDALSVEREALETALEAAKAEVLTAQDAARSAQEAAAQAEAKCAQAEAAHAEAVAQAEARAAAEDGIDLEDNRDLLHNLARRLRRMRQTSKELRASNQVLRDAMKAELPEASLVQQSLEAEIQDLKGLRAADLAEMKAINAVLRPMLVQPAEDKTAEGGA
ncbi:MAG: hypothetical protein OQK00_04015 [Rhodobacteraceae bacterium]|nr:hypothetical protein [Paracoccaceae bacterium]MCW9043801.1 hypothetical protein [Pseudopelagicola sp.]